ncbi:hypothetical protein B0H10DRAFT_1986072 [Mycena sp. CBHHK59/15]|nr:hypothetical protein B0H10DRAFT_1986072 [Mycena sp. CBHHK59/15]
MGSMSGCNGYFSVKRAGSDLFCFVHIFLTYSPDIRERASHSVSISSLLVEDKVAPIGIDVNPRFSWVTASSERAVSQLAYRIAVSSIQAGDDEVWDSGNISSSTPYLAEYTGPALQSDTQYFWTVSVATNVGSASASSNFTTGLLAQDDWSPSLWIGGNTSVIPVPVSSAFTSASWIWTSEADPANSPAGDRAFRFTYTSPAGKNATSAVIVMTVDDRFTFYVNGALVRVSPNVTDIWKSR